MPTFWQSLSERLRKDITALAQTKHFTAGEEIFRQGNRVSYFSVIVSGRVKVAKPLENGKEIILSFFTNGDTFMVPPLVDGLPSPSSAIALTDTTLLQVSRDKFLQLLHTHNELCLAIIQHLVSLMREKTSSLKTLSESSPRQRILETLLKVIAKASPEFPFQVPLRRQDIADMAGLTTETTIRVIRNLAKENVLRIVHGKIFIDDTRRLHAALEELP